MEKLLQLHPTPPSDPGRIEETIARSSEILDGRTDLPEQGGSRDFLASQLRFIGAKTWAAHLLIVVLAALSLHEFMTFSSLPPAQMLALMTIAAPLLALAGAQVLARSFRYGMLELELSGKRSIVRLVAARVTILACTDVLCLGGLLVMLNLSFEFKGYLILLYVLVPFTIALLGCLHILNRIRSKDMGCLVFTALLVLVQFFLSFLHKSLFTDQTTGIWIVVLFSSLAAMAEELRRLPQAYRTIDALNGA
ncbi:hypothetical protein KIH86_08755 [Paenibacillus sp. HN-1]|uniref:hypothetical protein n=1 Tax=Paenibacillus TaxID=44249 RepID=UPI001CAA205D|nr:MULTISPECIES: hypothetical protein [Paenibacillus]MBY9079641.1 hypothetical protein [Paenibacillus sp. CGMCC 1.18879]MBY9084330.1 hypothetical protein [Paenibacillus sinensis]